MVSCLFFMLWVLDSKSWSPVCRRAGSQLQLNKTGHKSWAWQVPRTHRGLGTQLSPHTKQILHLNNSMPHIEIYRVDIATASWKFISVCEGLRCRRKGFRKGATLHLGWSVLQSRHSVTLNCEERPMYWATAHSFHKHLTLCTLHTEMEGKTIW